MNKNKLPSSLTADYQEIHSIQFNPYKVPVQSERSGPIFRVHPYPTKIDYKSIIPFILAHTKPGEIVYDGFAGTCSTGFAAAACSHPDPDIIEKLGLPDGIKIEWGARRAICNDIGILPTFIGRTLLKPIELTGFKRIFEQVMARIEQEWGWLYKTVDSDGKTGIIRNIVYSDVVSCPKCDLQVRFYDLFVDVVNGQFLSEAACPNCGVAIQAGKAPRVTSVVYDDLLQSDRTVIKRVPVNVYGRRGKILWERRANDFDYGQLEKIEDTSLPENAKAIPLLSGKSRWGEMYRAGYHRDITHVHHFYTRRNYLALCALYGKIKEIPREFRDHYLLLVSSYNTAHSSLMARFVFKKGNPSPVNTSGQPGSLYISGCPVEKNVFHGVRQKLNDIIGAVTEVSKWRIMTQINNYPAQKSGLLDNSVDYIFTDPPFAGNIQYSELNFLSEAWLRRYTDNKYETIVSNIQGKKLEEYERLLTLAFRENFRILKPGRFMTVVFHSAKGEIWNALRRSILNAGFQIVDTSILDKTQTSFKQTTTKGAVKKDPIIAAMKPVHNVLKNEGDTKKGTLGDFLKDHFTTDDADSRERSFDYVYSRYIGWCMISNMDVIDAEEFRQVLCTVTITNNSLGCTGDQDGTYRMNKHFTRN